MGEWNYSPYILKLDFSWRWAINFQVQAGSVLGEGTRHPLPRRLGGPQRRCRGCGEIKSLPQPGSSHRFIILTNHILVTVSTVLLLQSHDKRSAWYSSFNPCSLTLLSYDRKQKINISFNIFPNRSFIGFSVFLHHEAYPNFPNVYPTNTSPIFTTACIKTCSCLLDILLGVKKLKSGNINLEYTGIACRYKSYPFFNLSHRWGDDQYHALAALLLVKYPGTQWTRGCRASGPVCTGSENLALTWFRTPNRPAHSE